MLRRNGQLPSCEPCRKGKLKCDHAKPSCGRCTRRMKPEQCIYHPAPLTKPKSARSSQGSDSALIKGNASRDQDYPTLSRSTSSPLAAGITARQNALPADDICTSNTGTVAKQKPWSLAERSSDPILGRLDRTGFLGSSSYSAVFTEDQRFDICEPDPSIERMASPIHISLDDIKEGAGVIAQLRDLPLIERLLSRWFEYAEGMRIIRPIYRIWIGEIMKCFGTLLMTFRNEEELYSLSELVWRNTHLPLNYDGTTTGTQWALSTTGQNLRWETVGLLFAAAGGLAGSLSNWDRIFETIQRSRRPLISQMQQGVDACIALCKRCECMSDNYVFLLFDSCALINRVGGRGCHQAWLILGEACDALVTMGLHQQQQVSSTTSRFMQQNRARLFDEIYGWDKGLATDLGRPPRLSHRYCHIEIPLDLSDREMMLELPELEAAVARLEDGWNTTEELQRVTWRRVWSHQARIREDILEISLGSDSDIGERASEIRIKLQHLQETMPAFAKRDLETVFASIRSPWQADLPRWSPGRRALDIMHFAFIEVGAHNSHWLLKRALVKRNKADPKDLIPVSRAILKTILIIMHHREYLRDFQYDLLAMQAFHGLPCAGLLAIELLKQEQSQQYPRDLLPRSETIQDLSVFIAVLGTAGTGDSNYAICEQGRRALKRLLDKILSPEPVSILTSSAEPQTNLKDSALDFPLISDGDFVQWLENVEWDAGGWLGSL